MNLVNKCFLYLALLPASLYRKMGVSIPHLKAILQVKLVMDDRRPNSIHVTQRRKQETPIRLATLGSMLFSALLGCFFLVGFAVGQDRVTQLSIYFSLFIFILTSVLISDFTSVLIDVRDNLIILPKPVNDKTFVLARLLHIVIHVSKMVLPMTIPGIIAISYLEGTRGLIPFLIVIPPITLFTIFLINALYIFVLKITTPEKFKNIISYFQIFFGIVFYASYQLVPRLIDKSVLAGYSISSFKAAWALPPYWFAAGWHYIYTGNIISAECFYFIISILVPALCLWIVIRFFAPAFNQKLSMINGSEGANLPETTGSKTTHSSSPALINRIAAVLTKKGAERMGFLFTWKMTSRSRDFKLKVYPSIGYIVVYLVLILLKNKKLSLAAIRSQAGTESKFLFITIIYFSSFVLITALYQLMYSEKYKASWIYYITPVATPGRLLGGAVKAMLVKFYFPIVTLSSGFAIAVVGPVIIPNLLLGLFNQLLICCFLAYFSLSALPFSSQQSMRNKSGNFIRTVVTMLIPFLLAVMHYMVYQFILAVSVICILSAIASWMMMDTLQNKSWAKMRVEEYA